LAENKERTGAPNWRYRRHRRWRIKRTTCNNEWGCLVASKRVREESRVVTGEEVERDVNGLAG